MILFLTSFTYTHNINVWIYFLFAFFQSANTSDSTPESESYEIVNKSDKESSGDETFKSTNVETVTSTTTKEAANDGKGNSDKTDDTTEGKCKVLLNVLL